LFPDPFEPFPLQQTITKMTTETGGH